MTDDLLTNLEGLKGKLNTLETNLEGELSTLKEKEDKWKRLDEEAQSIKKNQNDIVKFNVSGEHFATRSETLLKVKDSLFYKIVMTKKFDLSKEIFIDRSHKHFGAIMNYLRSGKVNYGKFSNEDLEELKIEADYYELVEIVSYLDERLKEPVIVNFTFSGAYVTSGVTVGSNKLEDISDRSLTTGICAKTPGWIVFELNHEFEFSTIEVAGYSGNLTYWASSNGSNSTILTSKDNVNFTQVGTVPSSFANNITQVSVTKTSARFIKFNHNSYLGLGYFRVIKS